MSLVPAARVVIVEDDAKIAALLADYLCASGFTIELIADGLTAVQRIRAQAPDVILLDLMLPQMDGLEVCKAVREFCTAPIIMLTARVDEIDRLLGLELGADDYICKPFSPREVVARVKAQLRARQRHQGSLGALNASVASPYAQLKQQEQNQHTQRVMLERDQRRILIDGIALTLTPVEFRLLAEMVEHPERIYSRAQLLDLAHEDLRDVADRTIDSHIKNIRKKVAQRLPEFDCLQSVYGLGYRFVLPL